VVAHYVERAAQVPAQAAPRPRAGGAAPAALRGGGGDGEAGEEGVEEYVQVIVIRRARLPTGRNRHGGICSYPAREDTGPNAT
jgi:hypothetical protein